MFCEFELRSFPFLPPLCPIYPTVLVLGLMHCLSKDYEPKATLWSESWLALRTRWCSGYCGLNIRVLPDTDVEPNPHLKISKGGTFEVIVMRADTACMRLKPLR